MTSTDSQPSNGSVGSTGPAPASDKGAGKGAGTLEARLRAAEAQALRAARDVGVLYATEKRRRQELEAAQAQQLRLLADVKTAYRGEQQSRRELEAVYLQTLHVLAHAVEVRDNYTGGHVERVQRYSLAIADALGLDAATRHQVEMGAVLHDVGKIGVPDAVLQKAGQLTDAEWLQMRTHPDKGAALLRSLSFLSDAVAAVEAHHERWDGKGYPHGLRGHDVPLLGRIVAVADAFDAMTSDRPYRRGMAWDVAASRLREGSGTQFDPEMVGAFLKELGAGRTAAPRPTTTSRFRDRPAIARAPTSVTARVPA